MDNEKQTAAQEPNAQAAQPAEGQKTWAGIIEEAVALLQKEQGKDNTIRVMEAIRVAMAAGETFWVPCKVIKNEEDAEGKKQIALMSVQTNDGKIWQPVFTSREQIKNPPPAVVRMPILELFKRFSEEAGEGKFADNISGLLLNFETQGFPLQRGMIVTILSVHAKAMERAEKYAAAKIRVMITRGDIQKVKADCRVTVLDSSPFSDGSQIGVMFPEELNTEAVIWTVIPKAGGNNVNDRLILAQCYMRCLQLMKENEYSSILFENLGAGLGYPEELDAEAAFMAAANWAKQNQDDKADIMFCLQDDTAFAAFRKIEQQINTSREEAMRKQQEAAKAEEEKTEE